MNNFELIKHAKQALKNSYSPYSNFPVGVALLTKQGKIYYGTNIENASYGATNCAERSAIFSALSQGEKAENFIKIAIISNMQEFTYPCCICRQVMGEFFTTEVEILMVNCQEEYQTVNIKELVPYIFTKKELENV
ncbi:MAG: cytidine deaminase [Mycoplasmatales bacterium]